MSSGSQSPNRRELSRPLSGKTAGDRTRTGDIQLGKTLKGTGKNDISSILVRIIGTLPLFANACQRIHS
jgi:hypothetical protein